MPFTYTGDAGTLLQVIRLESGDTDSKASQKTTDEEIAYFGNQNGMTDLTIAPTTALYNQVLFVAALVAESLAGKFAKEASYSVGGMNESANQKAQEARSRARELRKRLRAAAGVHVGGRSETDKATARGKTDLPQSAFSRGMHENV